MHRNVKNKNGTNFNPGLTLIGLSGTGPWCIPDGDARRKC